jgi:predicted ArsR family transcriptional regulator
MKSRGGLLLVLRDHPDANMAQLAEALGLTERRIQQMIRELAASNVVTITKRPADATRTRSTTIWRSTP